MQDSQYFGMALECAIVNDVGEFPDLSASYFLLRGRVHSRIGANPIEKLFNRLDKLLAESIPLAIVPFSYLQQFGLSFWSDDERRH